MNELFANFRSVDEDFFEELEETLIGADVGFDTSLKITEALRQEVKLRNVKNQLKFKIPSLKKWLICMKKQELMKIMRLTYSQMA